MSACPTCGFSLSLCPHGDTPEPKTTTSTSEVTFRWAVNDTAEHAKFLIADLVPAHCLVLITGREGSGKSTLAGRWLSDATHGKLPGDFIDKPMKCAVMGIEDSWHSRWIPRLMAYGADMTAIARDPGFTTTDADGRESLDVVSLTDDSHLTQLGRAAKANGVGWLYLDHLSEALEVSANQNEYGAMVTALKRLNLFARQYEVSVMAGWHLSKGAGAMADKVIGSVGIRSTSRAVLTIAEETGTGLRWLAVTKSNDLPGDLPARSFVITPATQDIDGTEFTTTVASEPEAAKHPGSGKDFVQQIADKALSGDRPSDADGSALSPDGWLKEFLSGGPILKSFVVAHGEPHGFSERSLERAALRLGIDSSPRGRRVEWGLPDNTPTTSATVGSDGRGGRGGRRRKPPPPPPSPPRPPTSDTSDTSATSATSTSGGRRAQRDVPADAVIDLTALRQRLETKK